MSQKPTQKAQDNWVMTSRNNLDSENKASLFIKEAMSHHFPQKPGIKKFEVERNNFQFQPIKGDTERIRTNLESSRQKNHSGSLLRREENPKETHKEMDSRKRNFEETKSPSHKSYFALQKSYEKEEAIKDPVPINWKIGSKAKNHEMGREKAGQVSIQGFKPPQNTGAFKSSLRDGVSAAPVDFLIHEGYPNPIALSSSKRQEQADLSFGQNGVSRINPVLSITSHKVTKNNKRDYNGPGKTQFFSNKTQIGSGLKSKDKNTTFEVNSDRNKKPFEKSLLYQTSFEGKTGSSHSKLISWKDLVNQNPKPVGSFHLH